MMIRFDRGAQAGQCFIMSGIVSAASIALFSGKSVLLVRRAFAPSAGHWSLPGGRLEPGEDAEACIRRETDEELGLELDAIHRLERRELTGFCLTVFVARFPEGAQPRPNMEIADWRWHETGTALPVPHTEGLAEVLLRARRIPI
jgi:8-oxo-dGTP diphosphatase